MFKQTEDYYKDLIMGFGSGSVYDFGCYLVSLTNGLVEFGYDFTPRSLNQLLKDKELWTREFRNYIDVDRLPTVLPNIFTSFKKIEPWNDMATLEKYLSGDYIVLGKVDARGIGGSGTHFVLITDTDGENAVVFDPWTGEHQPVANRYGKYGNILGLRIFGVKRKSPSLPITPPPMPENPTNGDLKKILDHYSVKTADELIHMVDEQLQFLKDARNRVTELEGKVKNKDGSIADLKGKHQTFLDEIASVLWGEGEPTLADETSIKEKIKELSKDKEKVNELEAKLGKEIQEHKKTVLDYENRLERFKDEMTMLREEYERKLANVEARVDEEIEKLKKKEEQYNFMVKVSEWFSKIFKKGKS